MKWFQLVHGSVLWLCARSVREMIFSNVEGIDFNFMARFVLQNMQLMYEHLTTLADLNKRCDSLFNEAADFRIEIVNFKVNL